MDIRCSVFSNTLDHLGNKDFHTLQLSSSTKTVESTNFTEHGTIQKGSVQCIVNAVNNKCITWNFFFIFIEKSNRSRAFNQYTKVSMMSAINAADIAFILSLCFILS